MINYPNQRNRAGWLISIMIVIVFAYIISRTAFQLALVQGRSMEPTFHDMQLVVIEKWNDQYHINDVVLFDCPALDCTLIKRIAAEPGDIVVIEDATLYVNGKVSGLYKEGAFRYAGILERTHVLKTGQFVVLGDNIEESRDSRYSEVSIIELTQIKGKVLELFHE